MLAERLQTRQVSFRHGQRVILFSRRSGGERESECDDETGYWLCTAPAIKPAHSCSRAVLVPPLSPSSSSVPGISCAGASAMISRARPATRPHPAAPSRVPPASPAGAPRRHALRPRPRGVPRSVRGRLRSRPRAVDVPGGELLNNLPRRLEPLHRRFPATPLEIVVSPATASSAPPPGLRVRRPGLRGRNPGVRGVSNPRARASAAARGDVGVGFRVGGGGFRRAKPRSHVVEGLGGVRAGGAARRGARGVPAGVPSRVPSLADAPFRTSADSKTRRARSPPRASPPPRQPCAASPFISVEPFSLLHPPNPPPFPRTIGGASPVPARRISRRATRPRASSPQTGASLDELRRERRRGRRGVLAAAAASVASTATPRCAAGSPPR